MIIPSIDIQGGKVVQLIEGRELALTVDVPYALAEKFSRVGEFAVIDLDAAMGLGNNREIVESLVRKYPVRVGGGIRNISDALYWLNAGASKIIIGTAAVPNFISQLPRDRIIVALDSYNDDVVINGWTTRTGRNVAQAMQDVLPYTSGFLITFVEKEGRLDGTNLDRTKFLVDAANGARITFAGGITTANDIAYLDSIGADSQVGMALYTGKLLLSEGFASVLKSDRSDGLWPTVVQDESGVLGLVYSNQESLHTSIESGEGVYWSRRTGLWKKGNFSGNTQSIVNIKVDCDRDALLFTVKQHGEGFCHTGSYQCFNSMDALFELEQTLERKKHSNDLESYTYNLFEQSNILRNKIMEEAAELCDAHSNSEVIHEAADLIYFMMTYLSLHDVTLADIKKEIKRRSLVIARRKSKE